MLESNGWTNKFFSTWFSSIESFSRVHDKKLSIAAIVALLTLNADQVPVSVQQGWPRLLQVCVLNRWHLSYPVLTLSQGIVRLFQTLPAAIKSKYNLSSKSIYLVTSYIDREEALKDDYPLDGSAYDDDEDEDDAWAGDDTTWTEEAEPEDEVDGRDESSAYLEFLNEEVRLPNRRGSWASVNSIQAQKFKNLEENDSDDELGEESLLDTPLDKVEPYQLFKSALMSKNDPAALSL